MGIALTALSIKESIMTLSNLPPLVTVGLQQRVAAPALQPRGDLPPEVRHVLQPVVQAEAAVRRVVQRKR